MKDLGWVSDDMPRLVAVQSTGCDPIVRAYERGRRESEPAEDPHTVAFGINVAKALGDFLVLDALYATDGCAVAVDDEAILAAQLELGRHGIFACPEGAATLAAAKRLRADNRIAENERVVLLNTGTGLKYSELIRGDVTTIAATDDLGPQS